MLVAEKILVRKLGKTEYQPAVDAMRAFTAGRGADTADELWLLEHPPVYTFGLAADKAHGPRPDCGIPVVQVDRGGEVTYHGPGQIVLYTLVDLARRGIKVKQFVALLEQSVIDLLGSRAERGVEPAQRTIERAQRVVGAPGVYVNGAKVAALGIRVSRGCAFHGLALNVDMDLAPFAAINPCGHPGMKVTQTRDLGIVESKEILADRLAGILVGKLEHA